MHLEDLPRASVVYTQSCAYDEDEQPQQRIANGEPRTTISSAQTRLTLKVTQLTEQAGSPGTPK